AVLGEGIGLSLHAVRGEDHEAAAMLAKSADPLNELCQVLFASRGIGELDRRIPGHQGKTMLRQQRREGPFAVPVADDGGKRLEPVEPERGHVANRGGQVLRGAWNGPPDQGGAPDPEATVLLRSRARGRECTGGNAGEDAPAERPSIHRAVHAGDSSGPMAGSTPRRNRNFTGQVSETRVTLP